MVRTQLYLDLPLHRRLKALARQRGRTVSDLVREALARAYAPVGTDERIATLRAVEGIWRDRGDLGGTEAYVRGRRRRTQRRLTRV